MELGYCLIWWYVVLNCTVITNSIQVLDFRWSIFHYKLTDSTGNCGLPHAHTVSYPLPEWSFRLPNMAALYYNHSTLTVKQSQANCLSTRLATPSKRIYFPVSPLDGSVIALNSTKMDWKLPRQWWTYPKCIQHILPKFHV